MNSPYVAVEIITFDPRKTCRPRCRVPPGRPGAAGGQEALCLGGGDGLEVGQTQLGGDFMGENGD